MNRLLLFFLFIFSLQLTFPQDSTVVEVGPGAKFHSVKKAGPLSIKILEIDLTNPNIKLETELARNTLGTGLEKTSTMSSRNNAPGRIVLGAINGDYFGISDPTNPYTFLSNSMIMDTQYTFGRSHVRTSFGVIGRSKPVFDIINFSGTVYAANDSIRTINKINGERSTDFLVLYNKYIGPVTKTNTYGTEIRLQPIEAFTMNSKIKFVVTEKQISVGNMSIGEDYVLSGHGVSNSFINNNINVNDTIEILIGTTPNRGLLTELIGGGPRLMTNGIRPASFVGYEDFGDSHVNSKHPRTALGINQDSTKIYFITVDGRQPTLSVGMACWELADYMISIGCYQGYNLDGGGSTVMVVRDNIVNSPSDGPERSVANALLAIAEVDVSTILDSLSLSPKQIIIDSTQTRKIDIKGFDVWGYNLEIRPTDINWEIIGINGTVDSLGFFIPYSTGSGIIVGSINNLKDTILVNVVSELMPIWSHCAANGTAPSWLSPTGNTERGLAYGFVNGFERVYVVNRPNITILNAATGDAVGNLNASACVGGTYLLNDIEVTDDGIIMAGNLTTDASTTPFKVYKWDSETSSAVPVLTYTAGSAVRLGDKITVVGSYADNSAILYASANSSNKVYKWTMSGGVFNTTPLEITLAGVTSTGTNPAVYPKEDGNSNFIINGNSIRPREHTETGAFVAEVPVNLVDNRSNALRYIKSGTKRYLITFQYGTGNENAKVLEVSKGLDSAVLIETTPTLGPNTNTTGAAGDVDYRVFSQGVYIYYVLGTNNGIASYLLVNDEIVPVELTSFTAVQETEGITLRWMTATETNNLGFEIERGMNDIKSEMVWSTIGFIPGAGTTTGIKEYSFIDKVTGINTGTINYRLKQIDYNGSVNYLQTLSVTLLPVEFSLSQNYPNPFNPVTTIKYSVPTNLKSQTSKVKLTVFDILGNEVATLVDEYKAAGNYEVKFEAGNFASGMYIYRLQSNGFVETRKMMLLK